MAEESRAKWGEVLEELVECPVCFERPTGQVLQCDQGHHICDSCRLKIRECPTCNSNFTGTRNYLAEALSSQLDDLKILLLNPPQPVIDKRSYNSVASQTYASISNLAEIPPLSYMQKWKMDNYPGANHNLAVHVAEMGLFLLNVIISKQGDLYGVLQLVRSKATSNDKSFTYELVIENKEHARSHVAFVLPCQLEPTTLYETNSCLHIKSEDMTMQNDTFNCTLTLTKNRPC